MVDKGIVDTLQMKELLSSPLGGSVFLFCGPEEYFKDFYCSRIKQKTVGEDPLNYTKYTEKTDPLDIINNCGGYPMFGEMKLIVVCDSGYFTSKRASGDLADFVKDLPETSVLVFREKDADKNNALYKAVKSCGYVFECKRQEKDAIIKLLAKTARSSGRSISKEAAELMVLGVGDDAERLLSEMEKMVLMTDEGEMITEAHVREVCSLSISSKIWDLTDAIAYGNRDKANMYLHAMLEDGEPPIRILWHITNAYLKLYDAKAMRAEGRSYGEIASAIRSPEFVARKVCGQAGKMTFDYISERIEFSVDMGRRIRSGLIDQVRALELIIAG